MARLEDLTRGTQVKGIRPEGLVEVFDAKWHGTNVVELTYKAPDGKPGNELLFRDREPSLEAFHRLGGTLHERETKRYEVTRVPATVRGRDRQIGRGSPVADRRLCPPAGGWTRETHRTRGSRGDAHARFRPPRGPVAQRGGGRFRCRSMPLQGSSMRTEG
jgi:hypothetical protein